MIIPAAHTQQRPHAIERPHVIATSRPITLGPLDMSARTARASAMAQLVQWGWGDLAEITEQIVSELVTNAVKESKQDGTPIGVRLVLTTGALFVEVFDHAPGYPVRAEAGADAESGRGLQLVGALSSDWGWFRMKGGKVVWAAVPA
jgi:serine/threonine-protein kinase RsbW